MTLADYLKDAATRAWQASVHDCCAFPMRWAGVSLPAYSTDEDGAALIEAAGGLTRLASSILDPVKARIETAGPGDIGVIMVIGRDRVNTEAGAIFTGERWAFASPRGGIVCTAATPLAVWRP